MKIHIKIASIADLKDIQNLNLDLFKKEFSEFDNTLNCDWTFSKQGKNYFKSKLSKNNSLVLVALDGNKVVGYLIGSISKSSKVRLIKNLAELENMLVSSEYRGKGIGTMLIKYFLNWCKNRKIKRVRVVASFKNQAGINFYKKNGFSNWDLVMEKDI